MYLARTKVLWTSMHLKAEVYVLKAKDAQERARAKRKRNFNKGSVKNNPHIGLATSHVVRGCVCFSCLAVLRFRPLTPAGPLP